MRSLQSNLKDVSQISMAGSSKAGIVILFLFTALFCGVTRAARAQVTFQQLYAFPKIPPGPVHPSTRLIEGADGSFYGTTAMGGSSDFGTVFKVTSAGVLTPLLSFNGSNGKQPVGALTFGRDGNIYGTTSGDGRTSLGTVFKMTTAGVLNTLFTFHGTNGNHPMGGLVQGIDGNFYGTTSAGGTYGAGTFFGMSTNGMLTTLFSFSGTNGSYPNECLAASGDDAFYGTTLNGGSNSPGLYSGNGTIFKITTNGQFTTVLQFNVTNGSQPNAGLTRDSDGNFYGTTPGGGSNGLGTCYRLTPEGTLTTLVDFGPTGGIHPFGGLTRGTDGNFYGTTAYRNAGSTYTNGTIFRMTTNGLLSTLVELDGTNGVHPFTDMTLASDHNLYGAMADATADFRVNGGTIFRLVPPPVITAIAQSNNSTSISWNSFMNGLYRVERNASLGNPSWSVRIPTITASGPNCCFTEPSAETPECYYRVIWLP